VSLTKELQEWLSTESIEFELWGKSALEGKPSETVSAPAAASKPAAGAEVATLEAENTRLKKEMEDLRNKKQSKACVIL